MFRILRVELRHGALAFDDIDGHAPLGEQLREPACRVP
jgi:hypothetical protein